MTVTRNGAKTMTDSRIDMDLDHARMQVLHAEEDVADAQTDWIYVKDAGLPTMTTWRAVQAARANLTAAKKYEELVEAKVSAWALVGGR